MKMKNRTLFGDQLGHLRIDAGITQGGMAEALGITPQYLCAIEYGRKPVSTKLLARVQKLARKVYAGPDSEYHPEWVCECFRRYAQASNGEAHLAQLSDGDKLRVLQLIALLRAKLIPESIIDVIFDDMLKGPALEFKQQLRDRV